MTADTVDAAAKSGAAATDMGATTFSQRLVDRLAGWLAGPTLSRRRFLARTAVVGSALAVNPVDYVLRPLPAYGLVTDCGSASGCGDGWTAFCATLSRGSNTCPPGSYVAGWWKVDGSAFCPDPDGSPGTRYYIDCNRLPDASCSAGCSDNDCDGRAVCRNWFRYGQCNQQIRGVTQVVCRVVTCAPPWEYDPTCTTTVRTDNNTRTHTSPWLAPPDASPIRIRWQDLGQTGSVLGAQTMAERSGADGGRVAGYEGGYLAFTPGTGVHMVRGAIASRYAQMGLTESVLGYPTTDDLAVEDERGRYTAFQSGAIYWTPATSAHEVTRGLHERYLDEGGPRGLLGYPVSDEREVPAGRIRTDFAGGWSIVWDPATGESRLVPVDVEMPADGSWPARADIPRWAGANREETAAQVAAQVFSPGVPVAYVARSSDFADALTGGVAAAIGGGPLLLTRTDELPASTAAQLDRLRPTFIVILGGTAAVSSAVGAEIAAYSPEPVSRIGGADRYDTAAQLSARLFPSGADTAVVTTGTAFADAVAGGPLAVRRGAPMLLTRPDALPEATRRELVRLGATDVVVLGGSGAVTDDVVAELRTVVSGDVRRVAGRDRYATAAAVAEAIATGAPDGGGPGTDDAGTGDPVGREVFVVTGAAFPDGLAAGAAAGERGGVVLLTRPDALPTVTAERIRALDSSRVVVIGGEAAVSGRVATALSYLVAEGSAPAGA